MPSAEVRNRVRALFAAQEGTELIDAIADEISDLHAHLSRIAEELRLLPVYQSFSERLSLLTEAGVGEGDLPQRVKIDASHLFVADHGFYTLEYDSSGHAYRWTGPRRDFSFVLYVDRRIPLRLELELFRMVDPHLQEDILLLADGAPVPLRLETARGRIVGHAILPVQSRARATSLIFVVPCVLPEPKGLNVRHLGVAFRELRVQPADRPTANAVTRSAETEHGSTVTFEWLMAGDTYTAARQQTIPVSSAGAQSAHATWRHGGVGRFLDRTKSSLLPRVVRIDAEQIEDGTPGFFPLEIDQNAHRYRWTGPGRTFSLTVQVDRSQPLLVRLCLIRFIDRKVQTPLTVTVDGRACELKLMNDVDGIIARITIPARRPPGPTTLVFAVPAVLNPDNADKRFLGVAFRYLVLEPKSRMMDTMRMLHTIKQKTLRGLSILRGSGSPGGQVPERPIRQTAEQA